MAPVTMLLEIPGHEPIAPAYPCRLLEGLSSVKHQQPNHVLCFRGCETTIVLFRLTTVQTFEGAILLPLVVPHLFSLLPAQPTLFW